MDTVEVERVERSETVFAGRLLQVSRDHVLLADGRRAIREVAHHPGAVAILPIRDDGRIVFVRQYRYAVGKTLLEIPAGTREANEEPDETGYRAGRLRELIRFYVSPGWTDEQLVVFVAEALSAGAAHPAGDERLQVVELAPEEAREALRTGSICDAKSVIALLGYFGWTLL
jgi:ADP-ribose pyrophosphatase